MPVYAAPPMNETCHDNAVTAAAAVELFAPSSEITVTCSRDKQSYTVGFWVQCPGAPAGEMTALTVNAHRSPVSCRISRARTSGACGFIPLPPHATADLNERKDLSRGRNTLARFCRDFEPAAANNGAPKNTSQTEKGNIRLR